LYEFKRGIKQCEISSVSFNDTSDHLLVASNTETVHLFSLKEIPVEKLMKRTQDDNHKFLGNLKTFFSLKTSAAKLHLQGKISCYWTTKESSFIGPMPVFAKEKEYFVLFFVLN